MIIDEKTHTMTPCEWLKCINLQGPLADLRAVVEASDWGNSNDQVTWAEFVRQAKELAK